MKKKVFAFTIVAFALMMAFIPAVLAGGLSWGDNFDGYAPGTDLHGVEGWKGWFNDPTFTAFTTDAEARTAPHSVDILSNADLVLREFRILDLPRFAIYSHQFPGNFLLHHA